MKMPLYLTSITLLCLASSVALAQQQVVTYNASPNGKYNTLTTNTITSNSVILGDDSIISDDRDAACSSGQYGNRLLVDGESGDMYSCPEGTHNSSPRWVKSADLANTLIPKAGTENVQFGYVYSDFEQETAFAGFKMTGTGATAALVYHNGSIYAPPVASFTTTGITMGSSKNLVLNGGAIVINAPGGTLTTTSYDIDISQTGNVGVNLGDLTGKKIALSSKTGFSGIGYSQQANSPGILQFHVESAQTAVPQMVLKKNATINMGGNVGIGGTGAAFLGLNNTNPAANIDVTGNQRITRGLSVGTSPVNNTVGSITASGPIKADGDVEAGTSATSTGKLRGVVVLKGRPAPDAVTGVIENGAMWLE